MAFMGMSKYTTCSAEDIQSISLLGEMLAMFIAALVSSVHWEVDLGRITAEL